MPKTANAESEEEKKWRTKHIVCSQRVFSLFVNRWSWWIVLFLWSSFFWRIRMTFLRFSANEHYSVLSWRIWNSKIASRKRGHFRTLTVFFLSITIRFFINKTLNCFFRVPYSYSKIIFCLFLPKFVIIPKNLYNFAIRSIFQSEVFYMVGMVL